MNAEREPVDAMTQAQSLAAATDPRIGVLCRDGQPAYYAFAGEGEYDEASQIECIGQFLSAVDRDAAVAEIVERYGLALHAYHVSAWHVRLGGLAVDVAARGTHRRMELSVTRTLKRRKYQTLRVYSLHRLEFILRTWCRLDGFTAARGGAA